MPAGHLLQGRYKAPIIDPQKANYVQFVSSYTLPQALNSLIQQNQKAAYYLLFAAASDTLLTFGRNNLGAQLGVTAVLHTWSQTLMDHYHLHCIVTGGGPALDGKSWIHSRPDYLFHVQSLSEVFQGKFCEGLQALYHAGTPCRRTS